MQDLEQLFTKYERRKRISNWAQATMLVVMPARATWGASRIRRIARTAGR